MKILYDHQIFSFQKFGGISRYFFELQRHIVKTDKVTVLNSYLPLINSYINQNFLNLALARLPSKIITLISLAEFQLGKLISISQIKSQKFDIFHPTYYDPYFLRYLGNKPFVLTVYDMIHELYPEYFRTTDKTKHWKAGLIKRASRIIAISKQTKADLIKMYATPENLIDVIYLSSSITKPITNPPRLIPHRYIVYIGNRAGYKNFKLTISAIASLLKNEQLTLLCVGGGPFTKTEAKLIEELNVSGLTAQLSITDHMMASAYLYAEFLIFPSLYEGFGLPIVEAFSVGCPVVCSDIPCFREIAGAGALFFDPTNQKSILQTCELLLSDKIIKKRLLNASQEIVTKFSWTKTAEQTLATYQTVYDQSQT